MKLFWHPRTRASRIVWLLEEAGLTYDLVNINIREPESIANPEFRTASPMGKVPALADDGIMLADSAAIGLYIADKYKDIPLAPGANDVGRGRYLYWMFYTPGVIEPAMLEKFQGMKPNKLAHGHGTFDEMIKTLEAGVAKNSWLMVDTFSAADVLVGSSVNFLKVFGILPDSDILLSYLERCKARDAYKRAEEIEAANS